MSNDKLEIYKSLFKYEFQIDIEALRQTVQERFKGIPFFGDILVFTEKRENIIEMNGLYRAIDKIKENVNILIENNKIDKKYIEQSQRELYFIFKFFLSAVYNQPNEEFIDHLSNYLCSCINEEFSSVKIKVVMLNRIARYTKQHIDILKSIYDDSKEHGWPGEIKNDDYNWQKQIDKIPVEQFIAVFCLNDLVNDGFLFQKLGMFNHNTSSPYEITVIGEQCLKMIGVKLD